MPRVQRQERISGSTDEAEGGTTEAKTIDVEATETGMRKAKARSESLEAALEALKGVTGKAK